MIMPYDLIIIYYNYCTVESLNKGLFLKVAGTLMMLL